MNRSLASACMVVATAALAAPPKRPAPPACLRAPAAKTAPALALDGVPAAVPFVTLARQQQHGDGSVVYRLRFADAESFAERKLSLGLLVKPGEPLAGRTFEQHAGVDMKDQPGVIVTDLGAGTGYSPRVSGVSLDSKPDAISYDTGVASTVRITFGKQTGEVIRGTIQLCIEAGQRDVTLQPKPTRAVRVDGTFEVNVADFQAPPN